MKSMVLQLLRAKTDWSGCCHMAEQGTLWIARRYTSILISVFLTGFRFFSTNWPHEAGWTRSRPYNSRKISRVQPRTESGTFWLAVRRDDHYTKQAVYVHIIYSFTLTSAMYIMYTVFEVFGRVNISGHWRPQWMIKDDNNGQMIFGDLGGLKVPDLTSARN